MAWPPLAADKVAHALGGAALAGWLAPWLLWWALVPVALVAAGKELRDRGGRGTYDPRDFWWTVGGGVAAVLGHLALRWWAPFT